MQMKRDWSSNVSGNSNKLQLWHGQRISQRPARLTKELKTCQTYCVQFNILILARTKSPTISTCHRLNPFQQLLFPSVVKNWDGFELLVSAIAVYFPNTIWEISSWHYFFYVLLFFILFPQNNFNFLLASFAHASKDSVTHINNLLKKNKERNEILIRPANAYQYSFAVYTPCKSAICVEK